MGWGNKLKGTFVEAGLPNITASTYADNWASGRTSGAMYFVNHGYTTLRPNDGHSAGRVYFDASRSSAVYGKSDTVQPPAYVVYYIIRLR